MVVDVNNQCVGISKPVGEGKDSVNLRPDVQIVQKLLNKHISRLTPKRSPLATAGNINPQTIKTIRDFQKQVVGFNNPDGRVDPAGKTLRLLNEPASPFSPPSGPSSPPSADGTLVAFIESLELRHITAEEVTRGFNRSINYSSKHEDVPRAKGRNSEPPPAIWHNIAPTLIVLDEIREQVGVSIKPTNTYRSPEYNNANYIRSKAKRVEKDRREGKEVTFESAKSGVATMSQHMIFRAIDFAVGGGKKATAFSIAKGLQGKKFNLPRPIHMANPVVKKVGYVGGKSASFHPGGLKLTEDSFEFHGGLRQYSTFIHIDCRGKDQTW